MYMAYLHVLTLTILEWGNDILVYDVTGVHGAKFYMQGGTYILQNTPEISAQSVLLARRNPVF